MKNLINDSQKCVKGRKITENIHLIQDLIDAILKKKANAAFIMVDQEKAFDRISHSFLLKVLKQFGFGYNFIRWIDIIYKGATSRVKVNGFLTEPISIQRGVRQGCPLSALLYVLCSEVLTTNIRKNTNIIGFRINQNGHEHKESIYADDLGVITTTEDSMQELFNLFEKYQLASNSKINKDKTKALWLGNWIGRTDKPLGLNWTNEEVKFLGVYIGNDRKRASMITFNEILDKIKLKISYWNNKYISKKGKVKVLNTFILTKFWYALEIHDIATNILSQIHNVIRTFLWNGQSQRELSVVCLPYANGGLSLQNIKYKQEVLRLKWLNDLMTKEHLVREKGVVNFLFGDIGKINGLRLLIHSKNYERFIFNDFYRNAYKIWKKKGIGFKPKNYLSIKNDWIYDNILLKDDDGRVFKPPGYYKIENLPSYVPIYFKDLPVQIPLGNLRGILRTLIPNLNRAFFRLIFTNNEHDEFVFSLSDDILLSNNFKKVYNNLLINNQPHVRVWENKWSLDLGPNSRIEWEQIWSLVHNRISKFSVQSSIWEMIHRNFICGYSLSLMNISDGVCKLCRQVESQRTHIFMHCTITDKVYQHFTGILTQLSSIPISAKERAFGIFEHITDKILLRNYITFIIRHILYRNRNMDNHDPQNVHLILINKVKYFIRNDLCDQFHLHKHKRKVEIFIKTYLVEDILGKVENNILNIKI